jgi:hypothetical protein
MKTPKDIVKTTFKLDRNTWRALRMIADEEDRDMNDVALSALRAYLQPRFHKLLDSMQKIEIEPAAQETPKPAVRQTLGAPRKTLGAPVPSPIPPEFRKGGRR